MEGAYSNQSVKCIVYTNDFEVGRKKLLNIEKEKNDKDITTMVKKFTKLFNEIRFSDGEEWIVVNPNSKARGYRWRKAWIDVKTSYEQITLYILPYGELYQWEDAKYFNWAKY